MRPVVDRLRDSYSDDVAFRELDAEGDGADAFAAGSLPGHPSYVVMQPDGTEVWRGFGILTLDDLDAALQRALAAS